MADTAKDPKQFPLLRNLQFSPIKDKDEQYVLFWDPTGLSVEKLVVPLNYFYLLQHFDGEHSLDQIGAQYLKKFGEFFMPDRLEKLVADLEEKLFLEGERVEAAMREAQAAFRRAPLRPAAFAGKSYEGDGEKLKVQLEGFFSSREGPDFKPSANKGNQIKGIVAPHYELSVGGPIYAWAYKELQEAETPDVFVILGTCHAGLKNCFAVTDKDFETPLGIVPVNKEMLVRFRQNGGEPFFDEDSSHRNEHSIEFQLPFLQHTVGSKKPITILPILSSFPPACLIEPTLRPTGERVGTFLSLLKNAIVESGKEVCVIASAELAHIGMRYGDPTPPTDFSFHRCMQTDLEMLKTVEELNGDAFAQFIHKEEDRRRISGFSAIYSLLQLIQAEKGQVLRYDRSVTDQFNSTVTYASMAFF
ncbi:MAG: AmmeMemoRadiSam system protein B [Nitrospirae bacterium]|nr:MAG: AmmeMemoRadiSam system protein B [Nitrospirota bacterium]